MTDPSHDDKEPEMQKGSKKAYRKPALKTYGDIHTITRGQPVGVPNPESGIGQ